MTVGIVTAPDERERCCVVVDCVRCPRRAVWVVGDVAALDYACVCADHVHDVRRPGDAVRRLK